MSYTRVTNFKKWSGFIGNFV